jgi:hypothetical protein
MIRRVEIFEIDFNEFGEALLALPPLGCDPPPDTYEVRPDHLLLFIGGHPAFAVGPLTATLAGRLARPGRLTVMESDGKRAHRVFECARAPA